MKAATIFREKRIVVNIKTGKQAIAELKIWRIPKSLHYPSGVKFSLYLVHEGQVIIGIDNHKPKGPHLHLGKLEISFQFKDEDSLIEDFWDLVRKAGFEP